MNRLERIKERVKKKYGAIADGITDSTAQLQATDDVSYLLAENKKNMKRFERIERLTLFYDDNVRKEVHEIAMEALKEE